MHWRLLLISLPEEKRGRAVGDRSKNAVANSLMFLFKIKGRIGHVIYLSYLPLVRWSGGGGIEGGSNYI